MTKTKKRKRDKLMTNRIAVLSSAVLAGALACSASPAERHATTEQRLDTNDGGDADADADPDAGGCTHAICATGEALQATCDPCATQLCAQDSYCCNTTWDATCVGEVASICGQSCMSAKPAGDAGASTCAHPVCATGPALDNTCDPCSTTLCAQDPYCCGVTWDATCVGEVGSICGKACN
jgi:hypothetical protein